MPFLPASTPLQVHSGSAYPGYRSTNLNYGYPQIDWGAQRPRPELIVEGPRGWARTHTAGVVYGDALNPGVGTGLPVVPILVIGGLAATLWFLMGQK